MKCPHFRGTLGYFTCTWFPREMISAGSGADNEGWSSSSDHTQSGLFKPTERDNRLVSETNNYKTTSGTLSIKNNYWLRCRCLFLAEVFCVFLPWLYLVSFLDTLVWKRWFGLTEAKNVSEWKFRAFEYVFDTSSYQTLLLCWWKKQFSFFCVDERKVWPI